jgi:hypothetical protein
MCLADYLSWYHMLLDSKPIRFSSIVAVLPCENYLGYNEFSVFYGSKKQTSNSLKKHTVKSKCI